MGFHPGHEGAIEFEVVTDLGLEEAPHILGVAVIRIDQSAAADRIAMLVEPISHDLDRRRDHDDDHAHDAPHHRLRPLGRRAHRSR